MGQSNAKGSQGAVAAKADSDQAGQNEREATPQDAPQKEKPKLGERRTSFYETVDASEVLPYLIIGKLSSFYG